MLVTGDRTCCRAWITFTRNASTALRPMSSRYTRDISTSPLWLYTNKPPIIVDPFLFSTTSAGRNWEMPYKDWLLSRLHSVSLSKLLSVAFVVLSTNYNNNWKKKLFGTILIDRMPLSHPFGTANNYADWNERINTQNTFRWIIEITRNFKLNL